MQVLPLRLSGPVLLEPAVFADDRGFFMESWQRRRYAEHGVDVDFVQDNVSSSQRGVLRGLHFQVDPHAQGKLVSVLQGEVFDVAVDIRTGSPTFGEWVGVELSGANKRQLYVPPGFAHGFCVTSDTALFAYKCTDYYAPQAERSILWNDPAIGIDWPIDAPTLSAKDRDAPRLVETPAESLPTFAESSPETLAADDATTRSEP